MRRRLSAIERHERALTRMIPGTLGGRLESPAPVQRFARSTRSAASSGTVLATFDFPGPLYVVSTGGFRFPDGDEVVRLLGTVISIASTDTVMALLRNGVQVGTCTVAAGAQTGSSSIVEAFAEGDIAQARMLTPGVGGIDATLEMIV